MGPKINKVYLRTLSLVRAISLLRCKRCVRLTHSVPEDSVPWFENSSLVSARQEIASEKEKDKHLIAFNLARHSTAL